VPLRAAAFEIPRKCAVFLRKKGVLLNGVQKVVSSNLTAPTIFYKGKVRFHPITTGMESIGRIL
jgi:hypothetical protein